MTNKAYNLAVGEIGTVEWADGSNPKVVQYFKDAGHAEVKDDETAWCAAFVGAMLKRAGLSGTGKLNARSYLDWGVPVELDDAREGDIVILKRGNSSWQGHVGFFVRADDKSVTLLGGNQSNAVNRKSFSISGAQLLGIRRLPERKSPAQSSTMQASAVQIASGAGAGVAAVGALDGTAQIIALALAGVVILAALWIMRERLKKWAGGDR